MARSSALILLGHGSHLNPDSSEPVYTHAARIRATGRFDQVLEAFWKEEPSLRDALDLVAADDVYVVPLFLAEGYFTREVLPRELGLDGTVTRRGGRNVYYCRPVGTHPAMAEMIVRRAWAAAGMDPERRREAALVIIGHGTDRSATSGDTVRALVDRIGRLCEFGVVTCGFLDEEPSICGVLDAVKADDVVLVPFFVAEGWHTRETIPADLGLTGAVTRRDHRTIWYTPPVGTLPEMADVILQIVEGAAVGEGEPAAEGEPVGIRRSPVAEARDAFFEWVDAAPEGVRSFLEVSIAVDAPGRYSIRHRNDRLRHADPLQGHPDALQRHPEALQRHPEAVMRHPGESREPGGHAPELQILRCAQDDGGMNEAAQSDGAGEDPLGDGRQARLAEIRAAALEIVRFTADGRYRPLRTSPNLRRGWSFDGLSHDALWEVLEILYPAAVLHWYLYDQGALHSVDYRLWASRQTAMYAALRDLLDEQVAKVIHSTCDSCLRHRLWRIGTELTAAVERQPTVPCREPCTVFATEARTAAVAGEVRK